WRRWWLGTWLVAPKRDSCLVASNADQDSGSRLRTHPILRIHVRPARSILSKPLNLRCSPIAALPSRYWPGAAWVSMRGDVTLAPFLGGHRLVRDHPRYAWSDLSSSGRCRTPDARCALIIGSAQASLLRA